MKEVCFNNKKGETLAGLLFSRPGENMPAVVVCHGFTGSKEGHGKALEMAEFLMQRGYASLLFDFAGCGESRGSFLDLTLGRQIGDLACAVDFCLEKGLGPIVTLGRSFGGTTAVCHAAIDSRISGVCTWAAPSSLMDLFLGFTDGDLPGGEDEPVALAGTEGVIYLKKQFFTDLSRYDVPRCASLIAPRPLLVVHGSNDNVVPPEEASIIYSAALNPKELIMVKGADHQFSSHYSEIWEIFLDWLKKTVTGN